MPASVWTPTPVLLGWIGALFASAVLRLTLDRVWNPTSSLGSAAAVVSVQAAGGVEPRLAGLKIWQTFVLQLPMWITLAAVAWVLLKRHSLGFREGILFKHRWFDAPLGVAVGFLTQFLLVRLVYWPLWRFIDSEDVSEPALRLVEASRGVLGTTLLIVAVVVIAPFVEEVYFRGLLLRSMWGRVGSISTVLITGTLFGLAHVQLLQLPALVVFGWVAAILVVKFRRLGPALWAHAAFNAYTVVLLLR